MSLPAAVVAAVVVGLTSNPVTACGKRSVRRNCKERKRRSPPFGVGTFWAQGRVSSRQIAANSSTGRASART